jgi:hypothetical protein
MNSSSEAFDILKKWQEENTSIEFLRPGRDFGSGASDQFAFVRVEEIFPSDCCAFSPDSFNWKTEMDGTFAAVLLRTFDSRLEAKLCDGTRVLFIKRKRPN